LESIEGDTTMMLSTLEAKIDPSHTALLVIDVQNDFFADGGAFHEIGRDVGVVRQMIPPLKTLLTAARSAGTRVLFVRYGHTRATESEVHLEQRRRGRADRPICQEGTWGAGFYEVSPEAEETVVVKHRYSGFVGTDLDLVLRSMGVRTLVMTGVASNGCVEATARDGFMHDYYIVFVDDCTASYDADLHRATLQNITDAYGLVVTSDELVGIWNTAT
jgi:ureidoacrylate peracid hydrolase